MATPAKKTTAPAKKATPPAKKAAAAPAKPKPTAMDYGYAAAFLKAHPDVWAKVKAAVAQGWTSTRLQAEIKTTNWWTSRTEAQRQADVTSKDNPAEWQRMVNVKQVEVAQAAQAAGITLSTADLHDMATAFLTNGASPQEMQSAIAMKWHLSTDSTQPVLGQAGQTLDALHTTATAYGVTLDDATAQKYTQQVLAGNMTVQGLTDTFREQAKILYPPIADFLDKNPNATAADYASPYLQIASKELGVPTTEMNIADPKWSKVFTNGAQGTPMTADDWTRTIRTDPSYRWDQTSGAVSQAAQMASQLQKTFGAA